MKAPVVRVLLCLLLLAPLAGCRPLSAGALQLTAVDVPGVAYALVWPEAPSFAVRYIPKPFFTITFDRPLAPQQPVNPYYIQYGAFLGIYPKGSADPYYGGPAADVFEINGNQLTIWAVSGGLPMGTSMVVLPAGLKAQDGGSLQSDQMFLVSQGGLSPHGVLTSFADPDDQTTEPLLWLPRSPGGPRIGYALQDGVPFAEQPAGTVTRTFRALDSFVLTGEVRDGWQEATFFTRAPKALDAVIDRSTDILADRSLTTAHKGWVPAASIGEVPASSTPGAAVVLLRSNQFDQSSESWTPAMSVFVPPAFSWTEPLDGNTPTPTQVGALEFRTLPLWDEMAGVLYRLSDLQVNGKDLPVTDPAAHPQLTGMSEAQWDSFRRNRQVYVATAESFMRRVAVPAALTGTRDQHMVPAFRNVAALEDGLLSWIRQDRAASATQLAVRLESAGLQPTPGADLRQWFQEESYGEAMLRIFRRYGYSLNGVAIPARLLFRTGSLAFDEKVRVVTRIGSGLYEGYSDQYGPLWFAVQTELIPNQSGRLRGTLAVDGVADAARAFDPTGARDPLPIIQTASWEDGGSEPNNR